MISMGLNEIFFAKFNANGKNCWLRYRTIYSFHGCKPRNTIVGGRRKDVLQYRLCQAQWGSLCLQNDGKILEYPPCFMLKLPILDRFFGYVNQYVSPCFAYVLHGFLWANNGEKHTVFFLCVFTCPPYLAHKPFKAKSRMREMKKLQRFSGVSWWGSWCVHAEQSIMVVPPPVMWTLVYKPHEY